MLLLKWYLLPVRVVPLGLHSDEDFRCALYK